jgi:hypothetical protein
MVNINYRDPPYTIPPFFCYSSLSVHTALFRSRRNFVFAYIVLSDVLLAFHLFGNGYFGLPRNESVRLQVSGLHNTELMECESESGCSVAKKKKNNEHRGFVLIESLSLYLLLFQDSNFKTCTS